MQFLKKVLQVIRQIFVLPIRFYQRVISPALPPSCLYEPSCSEYAKQAILRFGIFPGVFMGAARILRCNSAFFTGGDDPLPEKFTLKAISEPWGKFKRFGKKKDR
ncbi:MAG: membrane protein insertion efficiency factor YidD [Spirochaetes bacterium GWF1_51_8]|nr:MAG: membrane protein insertion efficiency factor YidD [Spirochaetes bacterium GWF1_51_8]